MGRSAGGETPGPPALVRNERDAYGNPSSSPLTANIYFPTIPTIAAVRFKSGHTFAPGIPLTRPRPQDLHVSIEQVNLSVTWYMILQGVSPTVWGSICDVLGRRPVYLVTFCVFVPS